MCSLSDAEIQQALSSWNPRNATVEQIRAAFSKVHDVLSEDTVFPQSRALKYLRDIFGNGAATTSQVWWIQNCASCGAPDDISRVDCSEIHLFLEVTTRAQIVNWLNTAA
jgi:hypothetical protein